VRPSAARFFEVGTDEQRLAGSNHILGECILEFARPLGQNAVVFDFKFEADFVALLEGDVEIAVVENLAQFGVDGAQDFILIEAGADGLADFGEQFVFLRAAVGIVGDQIVFERQARVAGRARP
jgi:hypothetical protein